MIVIDDRSGGDYELFMVTECDNDDNDVDEQIRRTN